jgi:hypothetical protein
MLKSMNEAIILPTPDEIAERIRACREELASLKRLQRMLKAAQIADSARGRRRNTTQDNTEKR